MRDGLRTEQDAVLAQHTAGYNQFHAGLPALRDILTEIYPRTQEARMKH